MNKEPTEDTELSAGSHVLPTCFAALCASNSSATDASGLAANCSRTCIFGCHIRLHRSSSPQKYMMSEDSEELATGVRCHDKAKQ
eukprot:4136820-Amphidinium_carterae.1